MSSYHIIRYILDIGYDDHLANAKDACAVYWQNWMDKVCRMFRNRKAPESLIAGLRKKYNPILEKICDDLQSEYDAKKKHSKEAQHAIRYKAWLEKNAKYKETKRIELLELKRIQKEHDELCNESYISQMQPKWDSKMEQITRDRENMMSTLNKNIVYKDRDIAFLSGDIEHI